MADTDTKEAILIDPVIDLAERDAAICKDLGLKLLFASKYLHWLKYLIFLNPKEVQILGPQNCCIIYLHIIEVFKRTLLFWVVVPKMFWTISRVLSFEVALCEGLLYDESGLNFERT